jgi:hypothetical protein
MEVGLLRRDTYRLVIRSLLGAETILAALACGGSGGGKDAGILPEAEPAIDSSADAARDVVPDQLQESTTFQDVISEAPLDAQSDAATVDGPSESGDGAPREAAAEAGIDAQREAGVGDASADAGASDAPTPVCPSMPPMIGSSCPFIGMMCAYSSSEPPPVDTFCTCVTMLVWTCYST